MRSSKFADFLNFHLRMIVQMIAAPAMPAPMTIKTTSVGCAIVPDEVPVEVDEGEALDVGEPGTITVTSDEPSLLTD